MNVSTHEYTHTQHTRTQNIHTGTHTPVGIMVGTHTRTHLLWHHGWLNGEVSSVHPSTPVGWLAPSRLGTCRLREGEKEVFVCVREGFQA